MNIVIFISSIIIILVFIAVVIFVLWQTLPAKKKKQVDEDIAVVWKYHNANPYCNTTGDCMIRAMACILEADWDDVLEMLVDVSSHTKRIPTNSKTIEIVMANNGFEYIKLDKSKRLKYFNEAAEAVVTSGTHYVYVRDGLAYDISDTTFYNMNGYFVKNG